MLRTARPIHPAPSFTLRLTPSQICWELLDPSTLLQVKYASQSIDYIRPFRLQASESLVQTYWAPNPPPPPPQHTNWAHYTGHVLLWLGHTMAHMSQTIYAANTITNDMSHTGLIHWFLIFNAQSTVKVISGSCHTHNTCKQHMLHAWQNGTYHTLAGHVTW